METDLREQEYFYHENEIAALEGRHSSKMKGSRINQQRADSQCFTANLQKTSCERLIVLLLRNHMGQIVYVKSTSTLTLAEL